MRRSILVILFFVICFGFVSHVWAEQSDTYYEFLKNEYNLNDRKLNDFLLAELNLYIKLYPNSSNLPAAGFLMAKLYNDKGDEDIAFALFVKQLYLYPGNAIQAQIVEEAKAIINDHGQYKSRLDELTQLLDGTFPECDGADCYYNYLAFLYDMNIERLYEWNLREFYNFIARFKDDDRVEQVQRWIADTYLFAKEEQAAQAAYMKYEQLYPENEHIPYVMIQRAKILYEDIRDYQTAVDILAKVITDYPNTDYAGNALYLRGEIKADKMNDYNGAVADFRQLVTDYPKNEMAVDALFNIAKINKDKLDASKTALGVYYEIVDHYPDDTRGVKALEEAAEINLKLDQPNAAAEDYARIARQFPAYEDAPKMLVKAGMVCENKLGNPQKAIEYYQTLLEKYPDYGDADKVEKRIVKLREKLGE
jgi:TolA-binding protein